MDKDLEMEKGTPGVEGPAAEEFLYVSSLLSVIGLTNQVPGSPMEARGLVRGGRAPHIHFAESISFHD